MIILKVVIFSVLFYQGSLSLTRSLIVTTSNGPVKGKENEFNGMKYYSYQGIPYAENPTGKLRFKPPVPRKPWTDVLDATEEGVVCSQPSGKHKLEETSEDCLNINIYVPANGTDKLLPVMVYVHGGALLYLSGNINDGNGPQLLLGEEIIFVTMNYRLGPFGFLSLGIKEASGNAGIKDVLLSLKWIKQNIETFGGNPDKITIAGISAGSLIINYLLLTNHSKGLFNRAILLSGSAFFPRSFTRYPKDIAFALANELNIETDDVYNTLDAFQKIGASELLNAYKNLSRNQYSPLRRYAPFMPTKEVQCDHALFIDDPIEAFRQNYKIPQNIPLIVGITQHEAINSIPYISQYIKRFIKTSENQENLVPSNIEYPIGSQRSKNLGRLISKMYFGSENMNNLTTTSLIDFITDTQYVYGVNYWINKYKNIVGSDSLYFYIFNFLGDLNKRRNIFKSDITGTAHGDDVRYFLLNSTSKSAIKHMDERSKKIMNLMINLVSNFVHHRNPTPEGLENQLKWPDYGIDHNYLLINENPVVEKFNSNPLYPRMQFWKNVYDEYYDYVDNGGEIQKKIIP